MKFFNIVMFTTLVFSFSLHNLCFPENQPFTNGNDQQMGKMPPITEEELNEMMQVLETLSPEELDALAKIGEDYIKEMETQGKDPFEELFGVPTPDEFKEQSQPAEIPTPSLEKPKEIEVPKPVCAQTKQCREILKSIAELISSIRLKAEEDRKSAELLRPWKYHLDDIVYFTHALSEDKLLKYVTDKEFTKLLNTYTDFEGELKYLEPLFTIEEATLEKMNPYTLLGTSTDASWQEVNTTYQKLYKEKHPETIKTELIQEGKSGSELKKELAQAREEFDKLSDAYNQIMQKEQAHQALNSILNTLSKAFFENNIIAESKKVLEKYEPEALKIKEEQEALEKKARKEQEEALRRRPQYTPPIFEPSGFPNNPYRPTDEYYPTATPQAPSFGGPGKNGGSSGRPGLEPGKTPSEPGKPGEKGKPSEKKNEGKDKDEGKKEETKKGQPKIELSSKVKKKLAKIEEAFKRIAEQINEKSPEGYAKGEDLFKEFSKYLTEQSTFTDEELKKAKGINTRLIHMTSNFNDIKREISDDRIKDLNSAEKRELKQEVKILYNKYFDNTKDDKGKYKGSDYEKAKDLLTLPVLEEKKDNVSYVKLKTMEMRIDSIKANMHLILDKQFVDKLSNNNEKDFIYQVRPSQEDYDFINQFLDTFYKTQHQIEKK